MEYGRTCRVRDYARKRGTERSGPVSNSPGLDVQVLELELHIIERGVGGEDEAAVHLGVVVAHHELPKVSFVEG